MTTTYNRGVSTGSARSTHKSRSGTSWDARTDGVKTVDARGLDTNNGRGATTYSRLVDHGR